MSIEFTVFKGSPEGIVESKTHHDGPTGNQVLVKITHSGICGTDEHYKHADMVLGHEGVGTVEQIGESVSQFKVGDIVGWGYTHKTCGQCEQCSLGQDQYCPNRESYGINNLHQGSFGSRAIWDASFLFKIPDGLAPEHAAPLMCGGTSVFEVIETYNIRPTDRVGVVGIGGLGHIAIQFLAKMGSNVVAFSSTDSKRAEALRLGASEFHATQGVTEFTEIAPLDHLLVTTSSLPDWKLFLTIMKPRSTIYPLTVTFDDFVVPFMPAMMTGINIKFSILASRSVFKKTLDFAARNRIAPIIERFPMTKDGVENGMAKLREGKMRYRGVLVAQ
ncbi:NAD(P)-dependent alcohol dehydrogenase protein [Mycena venus]|uniref:NAD(P)-dependent alcohol dehydrogenase protein n=1 Tax=Mycena venus TaxID=2733690 RepID=A0A8H6Y5B6_9AGAR|nr:NAD(P)-dependent alcohol dehydrogenase protein [Mycena venus]